MNFWNCDVQGRKREASMMAVFVKVKGCCGGSNGWLYVVKLHGALVEDDGARSSRDFPTEVRNGWRARPTRSTQGSVGCMSLGCQCKQDAQTRGSKSR